MAGIVGMMFCGTISVTCLTVGLSMFTTFTVFECSRFRWASVVGRALIRGIPLSGGRVGDSKPSRMATYSENVGIDIPVCTMSRCDNKKETEGHDLHGPG